ncbi:MAG: polymorphic toxin-type HINT domain-containing protein [Gallionella sp.]
MVALKYRFGQEVGTASVGATAISLGENRPPLDLVWHHTRIFNEPLDYVQGTKELPSRNDKRQDGGQPFTWIWGIGTYSLPGLPIKLGDTTVAEPKITLALLEKPLVQLKTYAQLANPEDNLVMKIVTWGFDNLATGGYMGRYDERLRQYNDGNLTYKEFANANFADVLTTAYATQVSFSSAGAIINATANAKSLVGKIFGGAAGGAVAGATFDIMLQAGLMEINALISAQTGQQEFSLSELLVSSGLGFTMGGAAPFLFEKIGELIGREASQKKLSHSGVSDQTPLPIELQTPQGKAGEVRLTDAVPNEITGKTEVKVNDKVVFTTPKAGSMTIAQASEWYRGQMNSLAGMIDKTLSLENQIAQADQLAQELMNGATASLYDTGLAATLREAWVQPSIKKLTAELSATYSGSKLQEAILEKLTAAVDKARKWFEPASACFAAGTLVHTQTGLVPIEQIKVGDMVLSKPESGEGEQAYKRVTRTFAHEPQTVMEVCYTLPDDVNTAAGRLITTLNHPFWVAENGSMLTAKGWTAAEDLPQLFGADGTKFELYDGSLTFVRGCGKIYISDQSGVGWMPAYMGDPQRPGHLWDFVNHKLVASDVMALKAIQEWEWKHQHPVYDMPKKYLLKLPVYNIEVEDFHTYYVGKHGVWVHNKNGDGIAFSVNPPAQNLNLSSPNLTAEMLAKPYLTRLELTKDLERQIPNLDEQKKYTATLLVRADKQSQENLIAPENMTDWLKHEKDVSGRLRSTDGVVWEYAKVFWDKTLGKISYLGVEGQALSPKGLVLNIDRKLAFVKAGKDNEVLRLLDRAAMFLEYPQNAAKERWVFEFGVKRDAAGNVLPDVMGLQQAQKIFAEIRSGAPKWKFGHIGRDANGLPVWVETAEEAASNARIRAMLGADEAHSLVELRNFETASSFPQNVTAEGDLTNVAALTLAQINALLPQARQYWLDAGASAAVLNRATFAVADLPFGMAGQTANNLITFDTIGAGWGWYVDAMPADQSEFQATAQATVFTAAATSEAANKLDLLTVLIHELGHVAGLLHTAATNDVMSQYLVPSERRLPDAVDLAALQAQGAPFYVGNTTSTWVTLPRGAAYSKTLGVLLQAAAPPTPPSPTAALTRRMAGVPKAAWSSGIRDQESGIRGWRHSMRYPTPKPA